MQMAAYYSVIAILFNSFWATVEVSHLAMIPGITSSETQRGGLSTIRTIGNVVSNVIVYGILWLMVNTGKKINA